MSEEQVSTDDIYGPATEPAETIETGDVADEPTVVSKADETPEPEVPDRPRRGWIIAAAVLLLGLIGAAFEGWLLFDHHQRDVAAAQALEAAEKYTVVLTSVDPAEIDKNFADVLDGATGEFKEMYAASSEQLRHLLIENKAAAHGTVLDAAVKSAGKNSVDVMLFVDQAVRNKGTPEAKLDRSRIVMTMEKVDGRWLAAKVDMP